VDRETLENIPTGRDPSSVLSRLPGIQPEDGRPSGTTAPGDALITIDGVAIGDPAALNASGTYVDFDRIKDIEVRTSGAAAEYGTSAGGVINVVTKSGTSEWQGTGRFLVEGGEASGLGSLTNPGIQIDIGQNGAGGYCLNGFQVLDGGVPVQGAGGSGSVKFGFDVPFTIGVGPGSGTTFGAGANGGLNLNQIPGCDGQPFGMSFVDALGTITPPNVTHLYFGQNGVYGIDLGRVASNYGIFDRRSNPSQLEDTHIFNSNFYLTGMSTYVNGGFQLVPQGGGGGVAEDGQAAGGGQQGAFLYGIAGSEIGDNWKLSPSLEWDRYSIRLGDAPEALPDVDGDGKPDSVFLSLGNLGPACPNAVGGTFSWGGGGAGGGALEPDAGAPDPKDCDYLAKWDRILQQASWPLDRARLREEARRDVNLSLGGVFGGNASNSALTGPIIKDRLWIWGVHTKPRTEPAGEDPPLFSESYFDATPSYTQLFPHGLYSRAGIMSAPGGEGVQGIGLEVDGQPHEEVKPAWLDSDRYAPGGAAAEEIGRSNVPANERDAPLIYMVAQGGPTGEVFRVQVVQPESGPVDIDGLVAVEPVAATAEDRARFERELAETPGARYAMTAAGYCLNKDLLPPPAGTVYRIAPAEKQAAFAPMRRALDAARRLRDAGQLNPDSDPADYYHSIRQWAVWTIEKGYDREGFLEAFVEQMEKNFREAGQPWSADVAAAVRAYGEGRWTDIRKILDAAEAAP
jgi:hypothetical protein